MAQSFSFPIFTLLNVQPNIIWVIKKHTLYIAFEKEAKKMLKNTKKWYKGIHLQFSWASAWYQAYTLFERHPVYPLSISIGLYLAGTFLQVFIQFFSIPNNSPLYGSYSDEFWRSGFVWPALNSRLFGFCRGLRNSATSLQYWLLLTKLSPR